MYTLNSFLVAATNVTGFIAANAVTVSPGTNTKTTAPNGDAVATFTTPGTFTVT
jgi:hypothetical protein